MSKTFSKVGIIGFGEAGPVFAAGFLGTGASTVVAYDILIEQPKAREGLARKCANAGTACATTPAEAVQGAELIVSLVTADQTVPAAQSVAAHLKPGQIYLDLNSTSPRQKKLAAQLVEASGALFVEGVAMDTVPKHGHRVPLLLSGPHAERVLPRLLAHDLKGEVVGPELGQACSIKLIRSILLKGLEALFAESMAAAGRIGVEQRIVDTMYVTFPGLDWNRVAGYHLSRIAIHGKRRAAEMEASAETVQDIGIEPIMASAIAKRHAWAAEKDLKSFYTDGAEPKLADYIAALQAAGVNPQR